MNLEQFELRLLLALVLGALIGLERQLRNRTAGVRTNALVAMGSALFVLLAVKLQTNVAGHDESAARIIAQIVSGIGFLGAGVIMKDKLNVSGLNTAATIWCSGAIGCLCGMGFWYESVLGAAFVIITHLVLRPISKKIDSTRSGKLRIQISFTCDAVKDETVRAKILGKIQSVKGIKIKGFTTEDEADGRVALSFDINISDDSVRVLEEIINDLREDTDIYTARWSDSEGGD